MATGFKSGGRKRGTPNMITGNVREMIKNSLTSELESLPELFAELKPKNRIDSLIKLLSFIIPKADESAEKPGSFMANHESFVQDIMRHINEKKKGQALS